MKRSLILLTIILTVLVGCGQKKETKSKASKQSIDNTLPVIANAEKETVVTKKLSFPKTAEGVQQTQTITYKGNQFLGLTIEQILPMKEELKKVVAEVGVAEAQKLLEKSLAEDEKFTQAKNLQGFSTSLEIINEQELKRTHTFDFQVLDVNKAANTEYLKNMKLKEFLKMKPKEYVEDQIASGATEVNQ
ncbi:hypothetical protein MK535_08455 [Streptococcus anginosus]|uniref:SP0191 family lipoprotein n=1 Tax=Streptococcus anginosus group TaxID=671232 RepID=UPI0002329A2A|nr:MULTISPECIES: SP0191 family lipoprotein [Streptococcus anginosus group]EHG11365.1 hypothetical protein HMPREF9682_01761 [Streptococcus intermedius F0395]MCY7233385.1 hypothetical protein [Streptococcus anginosus]